METEKKAYRAPSISDIPIKEKRDSSMLLKMKPSTHEGIRQVSDELGYSTTELINLILDKFLETCK